MTRLNVRPSAPKRRRRSTGDGQPASQKHSVTRKARVNRFQQTLARLRQKESVAGADFRSVWLNYWDLSEVDLRNVCFRNANLSHANLSGADLRGADLDGARLSGTSLRGTLVDGDTLARAFIQGADCTGIRGLSPAQQEHLSRRGARFDTEDK